MPRLLILFTLVNLVIGTGAFVIGGVLQTIADDLGVSVPAAGQAMSAYALATALLAPLVLLATSRWSRRHALVGAMVLFTLGNVLCALANDLLTLLAGRVLMGAGAAFTPMAAGIAVTLVEPARRGQALALVFLGMSLSYAVGVPLGAWLGTSFGWHAPVWAVVAACSAATLALWRWVPPDVTAPTGGFAGAGRLLRRPDVLQALGLTLLYFTAIFTVFSYIGPVLQALRPMSGLLLSVTLALFGVAGVVGTLAGGVANDRFGPRRTLRLLLVTLASMMALLPFTQGSWFLMMTVLMTWGVAGFGMMAPQQSRLAGMEPSQAPLLLSLNTSMLYFGTALGAVVGGAAVLSSGFGRLPWVGVPFALVGLVMLWFSRPHRTPQPPVVRT